MAEAIKLPFKPALAQEWGTFQGTGGEPIAYSGIIPGPVEIRLSADVSITLPFVRVFKHSYPLLLLGADVLHPQRHQNGWWYTGHVNKRQGESVTRSVLLFEKDGVSKEVECVAFPGSRKLPA